MLRLLAIAALATTAGAAAWANAGEDDLAAAIDLVWEYTPANGEDPARLGFARPEQRNERRSGMRTSMDEVDAPDVLQRLAGARNGEAVTFVLEREAGDIACTGEGRAQGAAGTCRYTPEPAFAAELARRGLAPDDGETMVALALLDARMASVDEFARIGMPLGEADDLVAVTALDASARYAGELRDAGLQIDDLDDLVAARALKVDRSWLAEMAAAGYPGLDLQQAIEKKALGVSPDYARRMRRVLSAVEGTE